MKNKKEEIENIIGDYKQGFKTDIKNYFELEPGLSREKIKIISEMKGEPEWMTGYRLKSYDTFIKMAEPNFGPTEELSKIDFSDIKYYIKSTDKKGDSWEEVPKEIKETFDKIGIPEAEQKYLAGVSTQFESEVVYHNNQKELEEKGVIFLDTDSALKMYPDLFKKYFGTVVPYGDNKYSALNGACWSGGSFIYIPKGVSIERPLQSYFRINSERMGQFERTLIIVDDDATLNYVEGCTAPIYTKESLHAAVVEIIVCKNAKCRYSTVQNWANNIVNLVTKRATVDDNGLMEWIDGNIGSSINMKYPSCILKGDSSRGLTVSIAFASKGQYQDTGAKMIHLGKNSSSTIISKSIASNGGITNYRGQVLISKEAKGSHAHVNCDTLILDNISKSDTIPTNICRNGSSAIEHEATVSKVSDDQLFYLMSRGLSEAEATKMIVMGFIEPFAKELPMEYAVELNQLIKLEMEGSIG